VQSAPAASTSRLRKPRGTSATGQACSMEHPMTYTTAPLGLRAEPGCDRTTLQVTGEIDVASAPQLREEALHWLVLGTGDLYLDLSGVTFADSAAVEVLLATHARAQAAGADVVLCGVPRAVTRLLELTSTKHVFHLASSPSDASAA